MRVDIAKVPSTAHILGVMQDLSDSPSAAGGEESQESRVRRGFWPKLRRSLGRIGFAREALAAYFCAIDPQTPARTKAILLAALAYFIAPVDLVPDIIAGLGFTDDAAVLFAAWRSVEPHIKESHRDRAKAALDDGQLSQDSVD